MGERKNKDVNGCHCLIQDYNCDGGCICHDKYALSAKETRLLIARMQSDHNIFPKQISTTMQEYNYGRFRELLALFISSWADDCTKECTCYAEYSLLTDKTRRCHDGLAAHDKSYKQQSNEELRSGADMFSWARHRADMDYLNVLARACNTK